MSYTPKIVHLPGTQLTPEVVLHRTIGKLDRIKSVIVIVHWDDDTFDVDWSRMKTSEMCMAGAVLQDQVLSQIREAATE